MTLVDTLCRNADVLDSIDTLTPVMKRALMEFLNFTELGAVSPDCPSLQLLNGNAEGWCNVMHYWKTADFIRRAVPYVFALDYRLTATQKCLAWLFGYTAHVVTDMTVHPVVSLKVGPYEKNKRAHRLCEMHQDIYIFHKMGLGEITQAEFLRDCGIASCAAAKDKKKLEPAIVKLWCHCLAGTPLASIRMNSGLKAPTAAPDPDAWFTHYVGLMDKFVEEGGKLPLLCRAITKAEGLVYPELKELKPTYIKKLKTPFKATMDYDQVFAQAQQSVKQAWRELGQALDRGNAAFFTLANGNLDTGLDEANNSIFWKGAA